MTANDRKALDQERQDEIASLAKTFAQSEVPISHTEQCLVDLQGYVEVLRTRNENLSKMLVRAGTLYSQATVELYEAVQAAESSTDRVSVTVEWLFAFIAALADPLGAIIPLSTTGRIRYDANDTI